MIHQAILDRGATLLAASPIRPEFARQQALKLNLTFPILHDQNNSLAAEYGLVFSLPADLCQVYRSFGIDLARFNGDSSWRLPMPARFIIGRDSMIHGAEVSVEYTMRPEPDGILQALDALGA